MQIKLMTAEINGEKIAFSSETQFVVQVSKSRSPKSGFVTKATFKGEEFGKMATHFQGINIGNGFRKRVLMNGKLLIRQR